MLPKTLNTGLIFALIKGKRKFAFNLFSPWTSTLFNENSMKL